MKPWSLYGIAPEWAALLRNYAVGAVIVAVMVWVAGFSCAHVLAHRPDPAIAADSIKAVAYRDSLLRERGWNVALATQQRALAARLDTAAGRAVHADSEATRRDAAISIEPVPTLAVVTPGPGAVVRTAADTAVIAFVQRRGDTTHYRAPKFFTDAYLALRDDATALRDSWQAEHALRLNADARFVDDSTHRVSEHRQTDSLNASLSREVDAYRRASQPFCQFKCGVITTLATLTAGAIAISAVHR